MEVAQQCAHSWMDALTCGNTLGPMLWHSHGMSSAITLAFTGASGAQYGLRLLQVLTRARIPVHCLLSDAAKVVLQAEVDAAFPIQENAIADFLQQQFDIDADYLYLPQRHDWFSPVASGSSAPKKMVVCPCSMGSLAAIAQGLSDNLIERAADVILKERGSLILVPRETPLSVIHLQNMLRLARAGAVILPAMPGFYQNPRSIADLIDGVVQRILDQLGIELELAPRWQTPCR